MLRTTKKEMQFFTEFSKMIDTANQAALELEILMTDFPANFDKIKVIREVERDGDRLVHGIYAMVNKSFITPIDREDIILIAKGLDEIIDQIEEAACLFQVYNVQTNKPEALQFATLIVKATSCLQKLIIELPAMKPSESMQKIIIEVNQLENNGDDLYRSELTKLFANDTDAINVVRWKSIYTYFEKALDACEDLANIIEGVVMKHA